MMARSRSSPLHIRSNLDNSADDPQNAQLLLDSLTIPSRISSIHLAVGDSPVATALMKSLLDLMVESMPILRSLEIHYHTPGIEELYLPEDFLGRDAPLLTRLVLKRCELSWKSPLLKNLTSLIIQRSELAFLPFFGLYPTITQFLLALQQMPALEELQLDSCLPRGWAAIARNIEDCQMIVTLPRLRYLRLSSSVHDCAHVMDHLSFPASTTLHVACDDPERHAPSFFTSIHKILNPLTSSGQRLTKTLLFSTLARPEYLRLNIWRDGAIPRSHIFPLVSMGEDVDDLQVPDFHLEIDWEPPDDLDGPDEDQFPSLDGIVEQCVKSLRCDQLETVCMEAGLCDVDEMTIADCFGSIQTLQRVILIRGCAHDWVDAFGTEPCYDEGCQECSKRTVLADDSKTLDDSKPLGWHVSFPSLRTLELVFVDLSKRVETIHGMFAMSVLDAMLESWCILEPLKPLESLMLWESPGMTSDVEQTLNMMVSWGYVKRIQLEGENWEGENWESEDSE
ncbi:hypothetical protein VNI00_004817 [Paramarasmius palmivorus]|uniref:F-box protein n=1 Tax=Paramarasmius palmivorus TaxID=297713 RepID=A0AAW0DK74_9AGAR